jgi:hypothetical protein
MNGAQGRLSSLKLPNPSFEHRTLKSSALCWALRSLLLTPDLNPPARRGAEGRGTHAAT